jgi:hypothetical protein
MRSFNNRIKNTKSSVLFPRLLIGLIVFICAEVFSGASIQVGLWNPWTWIVTYWLYFAHFFFFMTLAVRTGKTSLSSLYLWGVLFGLYESWITKVIWYGYDGDGVFAMGSIGPYGYSEISMVFLFHPVMSFIFPLAVSCVLYPELRGWFPELAWFTGRSNGARVIQIYLVITLATILGINSGGPINLVLNLAFLLILLFALSRLALPTMHDGYSIIGFSRYGFASLCIYLVLLYGIAYAYLRPDGLPSVPVQLLTFVVYTFVIAGLLLHRERKPVLNATVEVEKREFKLVKVLFSLVIVLALLFSALIQTSELFKLVLLSFIIWTPLGFLLTITSFFKGVRERASTHSRL